MSLRNTRYARIPNDIADLVGITPHLEVELRLQQTESEYHLIYIVPKGKNETKYF